MLRSEVRLGDTVMFYFQYKKTPVRINSTPWNALEYNDYERHAANSRLFGVLRDGLFHYVEE